MGRLGARWAVAICVALCASPADAQEVARNGLVATAVHAQLPPVIDGLGDDVAWRAAPPIEDFWQSEPEEGAAPTHPTEVRVGYDSENLYVLVRAFDSAPDSILHGLARRDAQTPADEVWLALDSYHDRRTGYEFFVNVDGVKRDNAIFDDGNRDSSWDGVWDVATSVDDRGWLAEFRIPLSQLRYPDAETHTFGLGVWRVIRRYPETATWPRFSRNRFGVASQLATLEGLEGLGSSRAIEATPYVVAKSETEPLAAGGFDRAHGVELGADVKLRLTPNLTVDATVNPDFGQVEADPAVLNLDAVEVFVNEQRPFFVEGAGLYSFRTNCSVVNCGPGGLFYSRRIGRTPELRGEHGDDTTPTATPIAAAAKLTGRTAGGLSFGALSALTRRVAGVDGATAEPLTNRAVVTAEQSLRQGEAGVRVLATAVNRSLDRWSSPWLHESAYAALLNARTRFGGGNYEVSGWVAASRVTGDPEAIERTQRSAVHYFQQPGDGAEVDPLRDVLTGHAFQLRVGKNGGGLTRFESSLIRHSAGFEINDLGFQRRADFLDWSTWGAIQLNEPTSLYRWFNWNWNYWQHWTTSGRTIERAINTNAHMGFHNNWNAHAGATVNGIGGVVCDRCTRGGPLLRQDPSWHPWFGLNTDVRRALSPSMWVNLSFLDGGRSRSVRLEPSLNVRASTRLDGRIGVTAAWNDNHTQWLENVTEDGQPTRHVFAHLEQQTLAANLRVNYTATPDLTVQLYAEPFVSRGTYSDYRELGSTPEAERYDERFVPWAPTPDTDAGFRFRQLRANLVVRWEYMPGSTVFLAWAHGRQADGDHARRSWGDELYDLFDLHPDNTFMIKVAHWISW